MQQSRLLTHWGFQTDGRIGSEEAAAIGAELLDGDDGRHGAAGNLLDQGGLTIAVVPIAPGSSVVTCALPSSVMGTPGR